MNITRIKTNNRMSQAVVHGNTVYLAGQVAQDAPGGSIKEQTKSILNQIDDTITTGEIYEINVPITYNGNDTFSNVTGVLSSDGYTNIISSTVDYGTIIRVDDDAQGAVEELLVAAESSALTIAGTDVSW